MLDETKNKTIKHYDLEVDFFKKFLDPYMKYTSGLFEDESEDLEVATRRMLDTIIDMGKLSEAKSVLEVGPGWGALLKRLIERDIDAVYTGVSPSEVQNSYISLFKKRSDRLLTATFESLEYKGSKLDAIVLIGSFCHLSDKLSQLKKMNQLLVEHGRIIIEDTFFISRSDYENHAQRKATRFVQESVFGFAEILSLDEQLNQIEEAGFRVTAMLEHSSSYKYTIDRWIKNLKKMDQDAFPKRRDFIKYMNIAQKGWNNTTHNQLLMLEKAEV